MNSEHVYSTNNESQHNILRLKLMLNWRHVERYSCWFIEEKEVYGEWAW